MPIEPLYRFSLDTRELTDRYPPSFRDPNKQAVHQLATAAAPPTAMSVGVTRWAPEPLPAMIPSSATGLSANPGVFPYDPPPPGEVHWHVNFATADIFGYYAGPLLAQDELQVLEHPSLASVRHALRDRGHSTLVVEGRSAYPILLTGIERRCELETAPAPGRARGLYGNEFAAAQVNTVLSAVRVIDPPTTSNIVAIEAPAYGDGTYSRADIGFILQTAFTAFSAARIESQVLSGSAANTVTIHTGFWGCGAYGGNRHLMTILQLLAARLAAVHALVYHTVDERSLDTFREARDLLDGIAPRDSEVALPVAIEAIHQLGFEWGASNNT